MEEITQSLNSEQQESRKPRPLGLSKLLIFVFTINIFLLVILTYSFFSADLLQETIQTYLRHNVISLKTVMITTGIGAMIAAVSLIGIILMWFMRRLGFYLFVFGQIIFIVALLFGFRSFDILNIIVLLFIIMLIGMYLKIMK